MNTFNLSLYQIIIPLICLYILFRIVKHYRRGVYTPGILILGIILWGGIALISLFPNFSNEITKITGIKSNVNAVIFLAILILVLLVFRLSLQIEYLKRDITNLVREDSIKDFLQKFTITEGK